LHRIIVEVVYLSHILPLDRTSWVRGRELEIELDRRENEVRDDILLITDPEEHYGDILQQMLLYIHVSQLLALKTPTTRGSHLQSRK
jgi:hypothetical protein